ncbi:MAG: NADH-quinone oxidoreductase subunit NuoK [Planctomycetes bacterium]|nr:NADH-quinone oxidoreductase subunit NuoK [Planctomycetota bacterium]
MTLLGTLCISAILFALGLVTFITRRNAIAVLMAVELILNAAALNFAAFAHAGIGAHILQGQVFSLFIIILAAAEAVVALALVMAVYREKGHIYLDRLTSLQG